MNPFWLPKSSPTTWGHRPGKGWTLRSLLRKTENCEALLGTGSSGSLVSGSHIFPLLSLSPPVMALIATHILTLHRTGNGRVDSCYHLGVLKPASATAFKIDQQYLSWGQISRYIFTSKGTTHEELTNTVVSVLPVWPLALQTSLLDSSHQAPSVNNSFDQESPVTSSRLWTTPLPFSPGLQHQGLILSWLLCWNVFIFDSRHSRWVWSTSSHKHSFLSCSPSFWTSYIFHWPATHLCPQQWK